MPRVIFIMLVICVAAVLPAARAMAQESGVSRLMPGDRINVTVFGQANLSGSFQIDGDGFIELPLIGAVLVKQLTPRECEKKIGDTLADGYLNRPVVSISVGEVRPIYVLGDVRTPAAYAFRPGSSVLSAIAQAGGYGAEVGGTLSDFLVADERVRVMEGARQTLLIRMARLEAQRDEQTGFTPPSFVAEAPTGKFAETLKIESEALRYQQEVFAQELKLQREQRPRLEAAQTSIEQQIESDKKQFNLVGDQLGDMEQLQSKGLSLRSREVALRREQSALDSSMSRYRSELARLAVTLGELDIAIYTTQNNYKRRVLAELEEARRRLQDIENTLPTAKEVRDVRSQQVANASGIGQAAPTYRILLSRAVGGEVRTLAVTGETLLQPGDVVEVKRLRLENNPGAVSSAEDVKKLPVAGEALPRPGNRVEVKRSPQENIPAALSSTDEARKLPIAGEVLSPPGRGAEAKPPRVETNPDAISSAGEVRKLPVAGEAPPQSGDSVETTHQENSTSALSSADEVKRLPVAGEALWQPGDGVVVKRPRGENSSGSMSSAGPPDTGSLRTEVPPTPSRRAGLGKGAAKPAGTQ